MKSPMPSTLLGLSLYQAIATLLPPHNSIVFDLAGAALAGLFLCMGLSSWRKDQR